MLTFVAALASVSGSPSFNCQKAATLVERTICSSPELAALDTRLATAFNNLQAKAEYNSGNAEVMEQRLWLRLRAERCSDGPSLSACLSRLYQERLTELQNAAQARSDAPRDPNAPDPTYPNTSTQDQQVCRFVAEAVERIALARPRSSLFLDKASWLDGGLAVGLGTDDQGTMHSSSPLVAAKGQTRTLDAQFQKPDESEPWAITTKWFFYQGRPYILRYPDWSDVYPEYVGSLTDDLSERPLCRLDVKVQVRLAPIRSTDADICRVIWDGGGETVKPATFGKMPQVYGRDPPGGSTRIHGSILVDAMNDGHPIRMYLYGSDSGAGAGCELSYYDTAPNDTSSAAHKAWNNAEGLNVTDAFARRTCLDDEPVWKRIHGRTYLLSQSKGARDPRMDRQEFLTVDTVEHGASRQVCRGDFSRRTVTITDVWRSKSWKSLAEK